MENYKMWIDGEWVDATSGKTYTVVNPATEEEIAHVPLGGKEDVDRAVEAARKAFPVWSKVNLGKRASIVNQIATELNKRLEEFAQLETLDHGSPIRASRSLHIKGSVRHTEYTAQASKGLMGSVIPLKPTVLTYVQREPVGVCALITPWNAPLLMVACKLGAALATGNTCVVKPPSVDSLTTLKLAEILQGLNMPPGTVNIITGPGDTVGAALASHNDVDKVAFTGAVPPGMVAMAFHFAECPTNELISSTTLDPVTRTPAYKTCPVRVRKIDKVTMRQRAKKQH